MIDRLSLVDDQTDRAIAGLIERAARSFDWDRPRAREYLFSALSLTRLQTVARERSGVSIERVRGPSQLAAWQLQRVMGYIDAHLGENIQTAELAALVKLSRSHFSRTFRRTVGVTVVAYLLGRRIERAKSLMRETQDSLAMIAHSCGFSDQSYFCRRFRREVGERPGEWRRRNDRPANAVENAMDRSVTKKGVARGDIRMQGESIGAIPETRRIEQKGWLASRILEA